MPVSNPTSLQSADCLYRDHRDWLVGMLRRKLGSIDQAADLAHDTFERILQRDLAPVLREPRAYLTTVANRLLASHYRRAALESAYLETLAQRPEAVAPSAQEQAEIMQVLDELCDLVDGLDSRSRRVFLMVLYEGLGYAEVAARLGVSLDIVKRTMSRVLQRCYMAFYA